MIYFSVRISQTSFDYNGKGNDILEKYRCYLSIKNVKFL